MSRELLTGILVGIALTVGAGVLVTGCGESAKGAGTYAIEIPGPNGVRCFAIQDGSNIVGGNCK